MSSNDGYEGPYNEDYYNNPKENISLIDRFLSVVVDTGAKAGEAWLGKEFAAEPVILNPSGGVSAAGEASNHTASDLNNPNIVVFGLPINKQVLLVTSGVLAVIAFVKVVR